MFKLKCDKCGEVQSCKIDGYAFGERTLEGVTFSVKIEKGKPKIKVDPSDAEYFKTLNQSHWLNEGAAYVEVMAEDSMGGTCPKCGKETVDVVYEKTKTSPVTEPKVVAAPKAIPITRLTDLLGKGKKPL